MDLIVAGSLLVFLSPLMFFLAILVRAIHGGPVLYQQVRAGQFGRPFVIYKFRTMTNILDEQGNLLRDEDRLTRFGQILRSTSLDELPELWNVLRGQMSLVGPRPLLMHYLDLYSDEQDRRHEVKPGITGLAQVRGRNAIAWEERFTWDIHYIDQVSVQLDLQILIETIVCVLRRDGISAEKHATYPMFTGSSNNTEESKRQAA